MSRPHLPAELRRAATVETVVALAAGTNPAEITTGQIAAHMGVTQGALFRHFSDKQSIWTAVLSWTEEELFGRIDAATAPSALVRLEAMFDAHIAFVVDHPGIPRILFNELQREGETPAKAKAMSLMGGYRSRVTAVLEDARESAHIAGDTDIPAAATLFLGMVQGLVMQAMAANDFSAMPAMSPRLFALFLTSIGARP